MPCPYSEVSGGVEVWTHDPDCDGRTESGARLSGGGHEGHGEVLLEVWVKVQLKG